MEISKCIHLYKNNKCNIYIGKDLNNFLLLCKKHYSKIIYDKNIYCSDIMQLKQILKEHNINTIDYFYQKIDKYVLKYNYEINPFLNILIIFGLNENEIVDITNYLMKIKKNEEWIIKIICELNNICKDHEEYNWFNLMNILIEKNVCYIKRLLFKNSFLPYEINTLIFNHLKQIYLEDYINMIKKYNKDKNYEYYFEVISDLSELNFLVCVA